jgi:hypothetical protein
MVAGATWGYLDNRIEIQDIYAGWDYLGLPRQPKVLGIQDNSIQHKLESLRASIVLGNILICMNRATLRSIDHNRFNIIVRPINNSIGPVGSLLGNSCFSRITAGLYFRIDFFDLLFLYFCQDCLFEGVCFF